MAERIYILGGAQTDFSTNWTRNNLTIFDLFSDAVLSALDASKLDPKDIDVGHVGNFVAELFTGQGMLGGFFAHIHPEFSGMPTSRHEGACASGSLAIMAAMADLESGRYETACVAGIELMRNVPGQQAADYLGAAAWQGREAQEYKYVWPAMFSTLAEEYDKRYGLNHAHLMALSKKNFANARNNPHAQSRNWTFTDENFSQNNDANPVIEGWMRRHDCAQVTDGAAVIFLATAAKAKEYASQHNIPFEALPYIQGWGHTTAPMMLSTKLDTHPSAEGPNPASPGPASPGSEGPAPAGHIFPWTRKAITDAYQRAGLSGPDDLDAIETHDCFSITEYMAIDHFGITAPGEAWKAIEENQTHMDGALPMNPSGGLIGLGHPVGATGVRMMLDASRQVTDSAGDCQVGGATTVATYNVGGSATTNCCFIVGTAA